MGSFRADGLAPGTGCVPGADRGCGISLTCFFVCAQPEKATTAASRSANAHFIPLPSIMAWQGSARDASQAGRVLNRFGGSRQNLLRGPCSLQRLRLRRCLESTIRFRMVTVRKPNRVFRMAVSPRNPQNG